MVKGERENSMEKTILMWGYLPGTATENEQMFRPELVQLPASALAADDRWLDIGSGGRGFAMAISESGKLFTWGATEDVGIWNYLVSGKHATPEVYPLLTSRPITNVAAGWANCCAVTDVGNVYAWGWEECVPRARSNFSELPTDPETGGVVHPRHKRNNSWPVIVDESCYFEETYSNDIEVETVMCNPVLISLPLRVRIETVATGGRHTLALSDLGLLYGWGYGGDGQLGLGSRMKIMSYPRRICFFMPAAATACQSSSRKGTTMESHVAAIACGSRHSAAITDKGELFTFGLGSHGQCGHGNTEDQLTPTFVSSLVNIKIQGIAAGISHTICTDIDGRVFTFGSKHLQGIKQSTDVPTLLRSSWKAQIVSCGPRHNAILTDEGEVLCWGWNKYGQLGLNDKEDRLDPTRVPLGNYRPLKVSCGWWHTLVLAESPVPAPTS